MPEVRLVYCQACGVRVDHWGMYCRACGQHLQPARIGRYFVGRHLGAGSAGRLLDGYDPVLNRPVALRILARSTTQEYLKVLRQAARLSDPGGVDVFAVLEPEDSEIRCHIAVLERIEGPPVSSLRTPVAFKHTFLVVRDALQTMARYHAEGLFHGKPSADNMLLTRQATAILSEPVPRMDPSQRRSWMFSAPENLEGDGPSAAADVYIAAMTIWTLVTGRLPFPAASLTEARQARLRPPSPGSERLEVLLAALHPRPERRPSMMEFYSQVAAESRRRR